MQMSRLADVQGWCHGRCEGVYQHGGTSQSCFSDSSEGVIRSSQTLGKGKGKTLHLFKEFTEVRRSPRS